MTQKETQRENTGCTGKHRVWPALCCLFLFALLLFPARVGAASYGQIGNGTKLNAWPLPNADRTIYADEKLTEKTGRGTYREYQIIAMDDTAVKIRYEGENGKQTGYMAVETFLCDPSYERTGAFVKDKSGVYLYRRPSTKTQNRCVFAPCSTGGITLGVRGKYVQVMMKVGSDFYLGWMKNSRFQSSICSSMLHTDQILADGTYTLTPRNSGGVRTKSYRLKYKGDGCYRLRSVASGTCLGNNGETVVKLVRDGAWFYLRSKDGKRSLNRLGKSVKAGKGKNQQWRLKKVYTTPKKSTAVVFSQYDPEFGSAVYQSGSQGDKTIASSGCALMALVNAVYALNGEYIPPEELAAFSSSRGHYVYNQGTLDTLYADVAKQWGSIYHFRHDGKVYTFSDLKNHLSKKGTAVALVPGHFIAIVAYRKSDGKYLVLDSAVNNDRSTGIHGDWKTQKELSSGTLRCEYFHLFSAK